MQSKRWQCEIYGTGAWRTFGRWLTNKDWSQLTSAESCKHKFHIFITELQNAVDTYLPWKSVRIHPTDRPWTTKRIKMLIKKWQTVFTREGEDSASYRLLRNKVQWEIRSAKYDYYHHKVSDLEQTDPKKMVETNQTIDRSGYTTGMVPSIPRRTLSRH